MDEIAPQPAGIAHPELESLDVRRKFTGAGRS
jgi:hypothetical protein